MPARLQGVPFGCSASASHLATRHSSKGSGRSIACCRPYQSVHFRACRQAGNLPTGSSKLLAFRTQTLLSPFKQLYRLVARCSVSCCIASGINPYVMTAAIAAATGLAAWLFGIRHRALTLQTGASQFQQSAFEQCPTLHAPYTTYPILSNGHFETIFASRTRRGASIHYTRTILDMPDRGKVAMDREKVSPSQVNTSCIF